MNETQKIIANNPLEEDELLARTVFLPPAERACREVKETAKPAKPEHYKVCCISLYTEDIERLENLVSELKRRGHTKANKSQIIRYALATIDIDKMPKGY